MIADAPELNVQEVHRMTRQQLIETLLGFHDYFSFRLTQGGLDERSTEELRKLLIEVAEHYRSRAIEA